MFSLQSLLQLSEANTVALPTLQMREVTREAVHESRPSQGTSIQCLLQIKEGKAAMCFYINSYQMANVAFRYAVKALYLPY